MLAIMFLGGILAFNAIGCCCCRGDMWTPCTSSKTHTTNAYVGETGNQGPGFDESYSTMRKELYFGEPDGNLNNDTNYSD
jgi:hypothetical protein